VTHCPALTLQLLRSSLLPSAAGAAAAVTQQQHRPLAQLAVGAD